MTIPLVTQFLYLYLNLETLLAPLTKDSAQTALSVSFRRAWNRLCYSRKARGAQTFPLSKPTGSCQGTPSIPFGGFLKINFIKILPVLVNEPQLVMIWFLPPFLKFLQQAHNQNKSTTRGFPAAMTSRRPSPFPASKQNIEESARVSRHTRVRCGNRAVQRVNADTGLTIPVCFQQSWAIRGQLTADEAMKGEAEVKSLDRPSMLLLFW